MEKVEFILKASRLGLTYGNRTVLKDINLVVMPGEFWFLLGPNGVGKTTLLNALLGILQPQEGTLVLHPELADRNLIGFVPQRCDLNPTLPTTVKEFVSLGLAGIRTDRRNGSDRLSWALEKMHLTGMEEKNYWSLSGGQRQRALVARALIRRPTFLIADEPNLNLDLPATHALLEGLKGLNRKENLTVLFVTHDLTLAARYATHIALFRDGQVHAGTKQEILNRDDLERTYGIPVFVSDETNGALCIHIGKEGREE
jgi:ABC-type Mn2+/Zn2+ transport system ATPase subunit